MTQVSAQLKQQVMARLIECQALVKKHYNVDVRMPTVNYDIKGTNAGTANCRSWVVQFNPVFLNENTVDMLYETVPHEFAHLATQQIYPEAHRRLSYGQKRRPHGSEWRSVMRSLGVVPSRTHNYATANLTTSSRSVMYKCIKCDKSYSLGPKRVSILAINPKALSCRCSRGTANLVRVGAVVAPPAKIVLVVKPLPAIRKSSGLSKMDMCAKIFLGSYGRMSRSDIISVFVSQANCTVAGASTYYSTLKKALG